MFRVDGISDLRHTLGMKRVLLSGGIWFHNCGETLIGVFGCLCFAVWSCTCVKTESPNY